MNEVDTEQDTDKNKEFTNYLLGGRLLSEPTPGEEIVISGIAAVFPDANNVQEFKEKLYNKCNTVLPNRRWDYVHPEIPTCSGTIPEIDKYDAGFFGVHERQSHSLDPMTRLLQEKALEAIFDAGLHPTDLENTKTGVFVGVAYSEGEQPWFFEKIGPEFTQTYGWTGMERSMMAHRLSYFFKLKGPSYATDAACGSALYALEHAYRAIGLGECDAAIVGGANLCLHPFLTLQFARMGVMSKSCTCKVFDQSADGYARSEAVCVVLLQKSKDAKRTYAQIRHAKSGCDGYKPEGITYPGQQGQVTLLKEFYEECNIDLDNLSYLEAHGTGTVVGDPVECSAIDEALARKRKRPLLVGSVKSNMGHSETASGLCSVIKCIIAMETGIIPPNLHCTTPKDELRGIVEGRMKVVSEAMPFEDNYGLMGINGFGFGGGNCHVLLKWNTNEKANNGILKDSIPRLVCVSGRTTEAVTCMLDQVNRKFMDGEYLKLLHNIFRKNIETHLYRGYAIFNKSGEVARCYKHVPKCYKPIYVVFGELNNWCDLGKQLYEFPVFAESMQRIQNYLSGKNISILEILFNKTSGADVYHLVGSVVIQIGIIDTFNLLQIRPEASFGYSYGELLSAYYDGVLSLEMTLECAIAINEYANNMIKLYEIQGSNGISTGNIPNRVVMRTLTETLGIFQNFKQHFQEMREQLLYKLKHVLGDSIPNNNNKKPLRSRDTLAEYFIDALTDDVQNYEYFESNSILLKIGSSPVSAFDEDTAVIPIFDSDKSDLTEILKCVGRLYQYGYNPQIGRLYPSVNLPVGKGTGMIAPYIKWKHDRKHYVREFRLGAKNNAQHGARAVTILLVDHKWSHVEGNVIDGEILFPAMGYLYLAWETLSFITDIQMSLLAVTFRNCKFLRTTSFSNKDNLKFNISIEVASGSFEIIEGDSPVVTGEIHISEEDVQMDPVVFKEGELPLMSGDIYKELRLRGYNYMEQYCGLQKCNAAATTGIIKWEDNWVPFLDSMLQLKILQMDTKSLYVPTYISKLVINPQDHVASIDEECTDVGKIPELPVSSNKDTGIIRCGGASAWGVIFTSITRTKTREPTLQTYNFIPNITTLDAEQSVRVNLQIILENSVGYKVKAVELVDEFTNLGGTPLAPFIIQAVLTDHPLVNPFVKILSKEVLDVNVEVENKQLAGETHCLLVIASNILQRPKVLKDAFKSLLSTGFILSRESLDFDALNTPSDISVLTVHTTPREKLVLFRKEPVIRNSYSIEINSLGDFSWVPKLQDVFKRTNNYNDDIVLHAENDPGSGIRGLVTCLRREPGNNHVKCVFIMDAMKSSKRDESCYLDQLRKNMVFNIYKNGQWGTYRHLPLDTMKFVESEHCFVNIATRGDLSSLAWTEGPLRYDMSVPPEKSLIHVYYAALNFRDVMFATGTIDADVITKDRLRQECIPGFEFSGRDSRGNRVMGMGSCGALSTLFLTDSYFTFKIPDSWTMEEAATVPVVYATVIYALNVVGELKRDDTILIHSGAGDIGQAAIRVALHCGCKIYTTVSTEEETKFLKRKYPQLEDCHIGNSRDTLFEQMIYKETNGRGVDVILNSLTKEQLVASARCLARGGRFLEIGKVDMAQNNRLNVLLFEREASFHGVMLDLLTETPDKKALIKKLMLDALKDGVIQPLSRTVYKYHEVEEAFRCMATGNHIGKVIVQVREPEDELVLLPSVRTFQGTGRYFCFPDKTYVVVGGLGGFGLELTDWLVVRGARKIVISARRGIRTGYQSSRVRLWRSYGINVHISTAPIHTEAGCIKLIEESLALGPIDAIYNTSVVYADSLFKDQTIDSFVASFEPKAYATNYLDQVSRKMCPDLRDFVVFSSVSCAHGNEGQTNYGMSNSIMERICEQRKQDGYPALAIQWGAVGEVGMVAEMQTGNIEIEIAGTIQQQISSCLEVLETFLRQQHAPIVLSRVIADKHGVAAADDIVDAVRNILGMDDKSVSLHATLAELGMTSMSAMEVKRVLETEFDLFFTANDMRTMTLARLKEIQAEKSIVEDKKGEVSQDIGSELIDEESESHLLYLRLKSKVDDDVPAPVVFLFPGIEGFARVHKPLASRLDAHTIGLQFTHNHPGKTIVELAESLIPIIEEQLAGHKSKEYFFVAFSYGIIVALEVLHILESQGYSGTIICIDGGPSLIQQLLLELTLDSEETFQINLISRLLPIYTGHELTEQYKEGLIKCRSWDERINFTIEIAKHHSVNVDNYQRAVFNGFYQHLKMSVNYTPSCSNLKSNVKLYKPTQASLENLSEDYDLSRYFEKSMEIQIFEGNHFTLLENVKLAENVNFLIRRLL